MRGYYVIKRGLPDTFHFILKTENHQIILTSEPYSSRQGAHIGIHSCQHNSPHDTHYDKRTTFASHPYFVLRAGNGEIVGTGQTYAFNAGRDAGISSCKVNGPTTTIIDKV